MTATFVEARPPASKDDRAWRWTVHDARDLARIRVAMSDTASAAAASTDSAPANSASAHTSASAAASGPGPLLAVSSERIGVVFSELATNALRHGTGPITAMLSRSDNGWLIVIEDADVTQGPRFRPSREDRPGGHGLRLVTRLARAAGWHRGGARKQVWAEVGDNPPPDLLRDLTR